MQVKFPFTVQSTQYTMCEEDQKKRKQRGRERGYDLSGKTEMRKQNCWQYKYTESGPVQGGGGESSVVRAPDS